MDPHELAMADQHNRHQRRRSHGPSRRRSRTRSTEAAIRCKDIFFNELREQLRLEREKCHHLTEQLNQNALVIAERQRADAAEQKILLLEQSLLAAQFTAQFAQEDARDAQAALAKLEEERTNLAPVATAAAAVSSPMPAIDLAGPRRQQRRNDAPQELLSLTERFSRRQDMECNNAFVATKKIELHLAEHLLDPVSGMLDVQELIGQGGFGQVVKAFCPALGKAVAIKTAIGNDSEEELIFEIHAYLRLPVHPHILEVYAVRDCHPSPAIALECGTCDLRVACFTGKFPLTAELEFLYGIALAVQHCHDNDILVVDLKPSNVILLPDTSSPEVNSSGYVAKLTDLGLVCEFGQLREARRGTPGFYPPEVANEATLAEHTQDVFPFGSMLSMVALKVSLREDNVFAHSKLIQTPEDKEHLTFLADTGNDNAYRAYWEAITSRTMAHPDRFIRTTTRPQNLNRMPGDTALAMRALIRKTTAISPQDRPTMVQVAANLLDIISGMRQWDARNGAAAAAAAVAQRPAPRPVSTAQEDDVGDAYFPAQLLLSARSDGGDGIGSNGGGDGGGSMPLELDLPLTAQPCPARIDEVGGGIGGDGRGDGVMFPETDPMDDASAPILPSAVDGQGAAGDAAGDCRLCRFAHPRFLGATIAAVVTVAAATVRWTMHQRR